MGDTPFLPSLITIWGVPQWDVPQAKVVTSWVSFYRNRMIRTSFFLLFLTLAFQATIIPSFPDSAIISFPRRLSFAALLFFGFSLVGDGFHRLLDLFRVAEVVMLYRLKVIVEFVDKRQACGDVQSDDILV